MSVVEILVAKSIMLKLVNFILKMNKLYSLYEFALVIKLLKLETNSIVSTQVSYYLAHLYDLMI